MGEQMTKVIPSSEIPAGERKCVEVAGQRIAVFNVDGKYYAVDDTCTHAGGPLSEGDVEGKEVTCPWHGATFDITCGKVLNGPAASDIKSYKVTVEGSEIKVEV